MCFRRIWCFGICRNRNANNSKQFSGQIFEISHQMKLFFCVVDLEKVFTPDEAFFALWIWRKFSHQMKLFFEVFNFFNCAFPLFVQIIRFLATQWGIWFCGVIWLLGQTCRQYPKIGKTKNGKSVFFRQRHTLLTSFDIFVVTYRVTNFLPKLVDMLCKNKLIFFSFLQFPIFGHSQLVILHDLNPGSAPESSRGVVLGQS